jgi:hypothetical protein
MGSTRRFFGTVMGTPKHDMSTTKSEEDSTCLLVPDKGVPESRVHHTRDAHAASTMNDDNRYNLSITPGSTRMTDDQDTLSLYATSNNTDAGNTWKGPSLGVTF